MGVTVIGVPSWSPDGQRIAVIEEVRSGGKLEKRLVSISVSDGSWSVLNSDQDIALGETVACSPDGKSLVFDSFEDDTEGGGIYRMEVESGETRLVTSCSPPTECIDIYPAWSPDGSQILFTRGRCDQLGSGCLWAICSRSKSGRFAREGSRAAVPLTAVRRGSPYALRATEQPGSFQFVDE